MAVLEMIDDGDNFESEDFKDEIGFQQRGMESNQVPVKPQVSTPKEQCEDDEPSKPLFVKAAKEVTEEEQNWDEAKEPKQRQEILPKFRDEKASEEQKVE